MLSETIKKGKEMFGKIKEYTKHALTNAVPSSMSGSYRSANEEYQNLISRYYPDDQKINIGSFRDDFYNYSSDIRNAFNFYKNAARKVINNNSNEFTSLG